MNIPVLKAKKMVKTILTNPIKYEEFMNELKSDAVFKDHCEM